MKLQPSRLGIAGGTIEYVMLGSGSPTIVLLSGHRTPLSGWLALLQPLADLGTVLAYDRFGTGGSDPATSLQDGDEVVGGLGELLEALNLRPPYVLVAHSLGGLYANLFARRCPEKVCGVVFLESGHPAEAQSREAKLGTLGRIIERVANGLGPSFKSDLNSEYNGVPATVRQIAEAPAFPEIPVVVVSGGKKMPFVPTSAYEEHQRWQTELMKLSSKARQVIARKSGHLPQVSEPEVVIEAIASLIRVHDGHESELRGSSLPSEV